ncbi:unnamed protein product [marine sediment metagenome]|uniref:Uncharacterized protein n=1 Tax=marine sediment metagenome TaxID=412755 RepID=X0T188_9ZZZZ
MQAARILNLPVTFSHHLPVQIQAAHCRESRSYLGFSSPVCGACSEGIFLEFLGLP